MTQPLAVRPRAPEQYPWSSCEVNAATRADALITRHPAFEVIGQDYRALFDEQKTFQLNDHLLSAHAAVLS